MHELRELLLRSGVSPVMVRRYLDELAEHREDLMAELTGAGLTSREAAAEADRRLGDTAALAQPMLADRRFQSVTRRAPMLMLVALPLAAQAGFLALLSTMVVLAVRSGLPPEALGAAAGFLHLLAPLAVGWALLCWIAWHRAPVAWAITGLTATALLGAGLQFEIGASAVAVGLAAPDLLRLALFGSLLLFPYHVRKARAS
jgi:hypothetical protein